MDTSKDNQNTSLTNTANPFERKENITIDELKDYVQSLADRLDQSHGKTRRFLDKFCGTLSSHSAMLDFLPKQSQYLTIFCGVVKTILEVMLIIVSILVRFRFLTVYQASDNYQMTLKGISEALAEIGDIFHLSVQHAKLINTSGMEDAVGRLYESVFIFLREAMLWYKGRRLHRLRKSFDHNFYDHFSHLLDKIKQKADLIHIRGDIGHHAKTTDTIRITRSLDQKLDRIITTQEEDRKIFQDSQLSRFAATGIAVSSSQTAREGHSEFASELFPLISPVDESTLIRIQRFHRIA